MGEEGPLADPGGLLATLELGFSIVFCTGPAGSLLLFSLSWGSLLELVQTGGPHAISHLFFLEKAPSFLEAASIFPCLSSRCSVLPHAAGH